MVIGYDSWDRFRHLEASKSLYKCRKVLTALSAEKREIKTLVKALEDNIKFLEALLSTNKPSNLYFHDLLANAKRRADLEQKFDDAVARLYRAIEVSAQAELKEIFGIETSNVKEGSIPETLREEYLHKYKDKHDSKIKIPVFASYQLLRELGSELAESFFDLYDKEIRPLLNIRNSSILAHGLTPVDGNTFQRLFNTVMRFSGTKDEDLPKFPTLRI